MSFSNVPYDRCCPVVNSHKAMNEVIRTATDHPIAIERILFLDKAEKTIISKKIEKWTIKYTNSWSPLSTFPVNSNENVADYDKNKPIYYEFTACPAAEFAKKHGLTDIMPALCNVDYASMELIHARLVRKTTGSNGCKCDYTICGNKDEYVKQHPEYRDEAGYRRNK